MIATGNGSQVLEVPFPNHSRGQEGKAGHTGPRQGREALSGESGGERLRQ